MARNTQVQSQTHDHPTRTPPEPSSRCTRITSLDGLRGLAALVVVLSHCFWAYGTTVKTVTIGSYTEANPAQWLTAYTPAHLVWLQVQPVLVFFILSGYVLTRPYLRTPRPTYRAYYGSRFLRLLLPSMIALLLAFWVALLWVHQVDGHTDSFWLNQYLRQDLSPAALNNILIVTGTPEVLPVLWSLKWEILFSLLLPLYVLAARLCTHRVVWILAALLTLGMFTAGTVTHSLPLAMLPVFFLGSLLAAREDALRNLATRIPRLVQLPLVIATVLALGTEWYVRGFTAERIPLWTGHVISLVACAALVVAAIAYRPFANFLNTRWMSWLGSRSFSLYLVHFPFVVGVGAWAHGRSLWLVLGLAIPLSLLATEVFYRAIERPSTALSQRVKRALRTTG
ncbi:acyltransferase family protein [Klugiella xanthotipulae]|uniref:acyltransferase family protein n=1 Tax=Klugiella xanthotipulae TaxID=244735 RepID=UPI00147785B8|nr:acyltransferase [Klugiella xanthotipulae]